MLFFGLIFVFSTSFFGFEIIRLLTRGKLDFYEILSMCFPIGLILKICCSFLINSFIGLNIIHFILLFISSLSLATFLKFLNKKRLSLPRKTYFTYFSFILSIIIAKKLSSLAFLSGKTVLNFKNIQYEVGIINSFVVGCNKYSSFITGVRNPFCYGMNMYTDFIPEMYEAFLKISGCSLKNSISLVTFVLLNSAFLLQYNLTYRISNNEITSCLSMLVFMFIGGFGFMRMANDSNFVKGVNFVDYFSKNDFIYWGHPILNCYIASRTNLLSLCLSLVCCLLVDSETKTKGKFTMFTLAGIICSISVLVRNQFGVVLYILLMIYRAESLHSSLRYFVFIIPMSILLGLKIYFSPPLWVYGSCKRSFFKPLSFFFMTHGTILLCNILVTSKKDFIRIVKFYGIFVLLCFIQLQSNQEKNYITILTTITPLIVITGLKNLIDIYYYITTEDLQGVFMAVVLICIVTSVLSSLVGIYNIKKYPDFLWSYDDEELARWCLANTSRKSVFLIEDSILINPVTDLAGRISYYSDHNLYWMVLTKYLRKRLNKYSNLMRGVNITLPKKINYLLCTDSDFCHHIRSKYKTMLIHKSYSYSVYKFI